MRRYYNKDFNSSTDYIKKKRNVTESLFLDKLYFYLQTNIGVDLLAKVGIKDEDFIFNLGSLLYPKEMIKLH